jgi:hypothetical protein
MCVQFARGVLGLRAKCLRLQVATLGVLLSSKTACVIPWTNFASHYGRMTRVLRAALPHLLVERDGVSCSNS